MQFSIFKAKSLAKIIAVTFGTLLFALPSAQALDEDTAEIISMSKWRFYDGGEAVNLTFRSGGKVTFAVGGELYWGTFTAKGETICFKQADFFGSRPVCGEAGWEGEDAYWDDYDLYER